MEPFFQIGWSSCTHCRIPSRILSESGAEIASANASHGPNLTKQSHVYVRAFLRNCVHGCEEFTGVANVKTKKDLLSILSGDMSRTAAMSKETLRKLPIEHPDSLMARWCPQLDRLIVQAHLVLLCFRHEGSGRSLQPVYNLLGTQDLNRFRTMLPDHVSLKNHMLTSPKDVAPYIKGILDQTCAPMLVCVYVLLSMLQSKLKPFIGVVQSCLLLVLKGRPRFLELECQLPPESVVEHP
jgi:hypothetical protein